MAKSTGSSKGTVWVRAKCTGQLPSSTQAVGIRIPFPWFWKVWRPEVTAGMSTVTSFQRLTLKLGTTELLLFCGAPATPPPGPKAAGFSTAAPPKAAPPTGKGKSRS